MIWHFIGGHFGGIFPRHLREPINDRLDTKMQKVSICYGTYLRIEINVVLRDKIGYDSFSYHESEIEILIFHLT